MSGAINDLGNGTGFIYESLQNNTVTASTPNTPLGVRNMLDKAAANAPIAANRSAWATITITSVNSTGAFSVVSVSGVNQIGANVTVLTNNTTTEAARLAAAINLFTPASGLNFTAIAVANVITIFEPQSGAGATNGVLPVVSVTDVSIVTTVVVFQGGAPPAGVYDLNFGRKYWLNSAVDAISNSLSGAEEITKYLTLRGMNAGMPTQDLTVATDRLTPDRYSALTHIKADTEGAAASDYCVFINPTGFVEGDLLLIAGENSARTVNVVSQPNASAVSSTPDPNIYLHNNSQFSTSGSIGATLLLKYTYDDSRGAIFVEVMRTGGSASCINPVTKAEMDALVTAGGLSQGCRYIITDRPSVGVNLRMGMGIILNAAATNKLELRAEALYLNADYQSAGVYSGVTGFAGNVGIWYSGMSVPAINSVAIYNNLHYKNLTGAVGTAPSGDVVNWVLLSASLTNGYILVADEIEYDYPNDFIQNSKDRLKNDIGSTFASGINAVGTFQWGRTSTFNNYERNNTTSNRNLRQNYSNNIGDAGTFTTTGAFNLTDSVAKNGGTVSNASQSVQYALADGSGCVASASYARATGISCIASAPHAIANGTSCTASSDYAEADGQNCTASSGYAKALGNSCLASGSNSFAKGETCQATAANTIAIGSSCTASAEGAIAMGIGCIASGIRSVAIGDHAQALNESAFARGVHGQSAAPNEEVVGWANPADAGLDSAQQRRRMIELGLIQLPASTPTKLITKFGGGNITLVPAHNYNFELQLVANNTIGTDRANWDIKGQLYNNSGTITADGNILYMDSSGVYQTSHQRRFATGGFTPTVYSIGGTGNILDIMVEGIYGINFKGHIELEQCG